MDLNSSNTQYVSMALELFTLCGANTQKPLRTSILLDKFSEFSKNHQGEDNILKAVLDSHNDSVINVSELAVALHDHYKHADNKEDLDESFNFVKTGLTPLDSDSGISSDGYHLMEDLQTELKEKSHMIHKLREQMECTELLHEDTVSTVTAERDSLRKQLTILREENLTLMTIKRDYEELCDKHCGNELVLDKMRKELDLVMRRERASQEQIALLEGDKVTYHELLMKSKEECHRINEMYANRQSALLEQNESLRTQYAELTQRHQHQESFTQQLCREKVLLEMELKDLLNKSNHTQHIDQSIEVSYTEDQILTQLDSLQADSRFSSENRLLDEESFLNALKEDQGRTTNMSLFDEIKLSFCNLSKPNFDFNDTSCDKEILNISMTTVATQTDDDTSENYDNYDQSSPQCRTETFTQTECKLCHIETQYDLKIEQNHVPIEADKKKYTTSTQTKVNSTYIEGNRPANTLRCNRCVKLTEYVNKLENDLTDSNESLTKMQLEMERYEDNLNLLQNCFESENSKNEILQFSVDNLTNKLGIMDEALAKNMDILNGLHRESCCAQMQTESDTTSVGIQAETPCMDCASRTAVAPHSAFRRYLWEPVKSLFQLFAVVCFISAISVLYNVTARGRACVPWKWMHAQDLMDLLFRIEYVSDVPM